MTLDEILTEVRDFTEDPGDIRFGGGAATLKKRYINQAQLDIVKRGRLLMTNATLAESATTPTYSLYTLPSDLISIERVQIAGRPLVRVDLSFFDCRTDDWESDIGESDRYLDRGFGEGVIRLHPYLTTDQEPKCFYYARPATLTNGTDVPQINAAYHMAIAYRTVQMCYSKDSRVANPAKSEEFRLKYEEELAGLMQDEPNTESYVELPYL